MEEVPQAACETIEAVDGEEPVSGIDVFSPPRANPDWQD